jgi:hypothetical protein
MHFKKFYKLKSSVLILSVIARRVKCRGEGTRAMEVFSG